MLQSIMARCSITPALSWTVATRWEREEWLRHTWSRRELRSHAAPPVLPIHPARRSFPSRESAHLTSCAAPIQMHSYMPDRLLRGRLHSRGCPIPGFLHL